MKLNQLKDNPGSRKKPITVGRGIGSGKGKTCGRGVKGQKARTGVALKGFEGGQMPLIRRIPKRGFNNIFAKQYAALTVDRLQAAIDDGVISAKDSITADVLLKAGVVKKSRDGVRLIGNGDMKAKVSIAVAGASAGARAAVEKAGGQITIVVPELPANQKAQKAKKSAA